MNESEHPESALDRAIDERAKAMTSVSVPQQLRSEVRRRIGAAEAANVPRWMWILIPAAAVIVIVAVGILRSSVAGTRREAPVAGAAGAATGPVGKGQVDAPSPVVPPRASAAAAAPVHVAASRRTVRRPTTVIEVPVER